MSNTTNYHPEYVPQISPMDSPLRFIEDYLREHFFMTELYTNEMMANEKKSPSECVQYVYNKAFEIAYNARQRMANGKGEYGASFGSDHYLVLWAKYYYENDVEVKAMPTNVMAVSAASSAPKKSPEEPKAKDEKKPTKADIKADAQAKAKEDVEKAKADAQAKAKEDVEKAKADATKIAKDAKAAAQEQPKSGYLDPDYRHDEDEDEDEKPQAPIYDIKLPPKGNAPKVSSQFKRGSKEYKEALAKQCEEADLFGDLFGDE